MVVSCVITAITLTRVLSLAGSYLTVKALSLTLRDAQHLSWKTFKKFEMAEQTNSKAHATGEDLIKKSVEVAQKIQKLQNPDTAANKTEFAKLLSELLFSTFILAEQQGVSLEESFLQAIDEMILRSVS